MFVIPVKLLQSVKLKPVLKHFCDLSMINLSRYNKYFIRSAVHQIEETNIILHLLPNLFDIILPIFIFKALDYAN